MSAEGTEGQTIYPFCRVCLVSKVRMCPIENTELQELYGKIINQQNKQYAVPQTICYICYAQLRRSYRFSKMAHKSQMILEYMHQQGVEVHKREMPNFENVFKLSVSDISITSRPSSTSGDYRAEDHVIVKEEIISEGEIKQEEVSLEQEENISDFIIDVFTKDEPIDDSFPEKKEQTSTAIPNDSQSINLHNMSSTQDYLNNKQTNSLQTRKKNLSITSRPSSTNGNCRAVEDHDIVNEEIISEGEIKIEEVSSEQEENIFEIFIDPNQKYTEDEPIEESSSKKTKQAIPKIQSINLHKINSTKDYLINKQTNSLQTRKKNRIRKKTVSCTICMKAFASNHLQSHMRTHSDLKPFVCKICNKSFRENNTLVRHKAIHNPEKPFKCQMCSKTYSHARTYQYHMSTHTGEEPYACNMCNKGFINKYRLQRHLTVHTREKLFVCNICDKRFVEKSGLKKHMRIHTGEKPHVCNTCNKAFMYTNNLLSHIRTHTGEKPYVCHICNKRFSESGNLKKHVRTHNEN